jgi:rhodanese-related sulfurtransferase
MREPDEWRFCRIEGAHVPMNQIEQRVAELDPTRDTVVYCHLGVRSQMVAEFLISKGFSRVASLAGGIDAGQCA